jgi:pimeloyl-ACP methyl ester carboxylesterase
MTYEEDYMSLINVRGIDFFYQEAGEGAPILLIHGATGNADVWSSVFEPLARDHRVIAYDRRAHTRSKAATPPPAEYYSTHGDDAAALLQALAATPATVVGWSGGGLTALHLASKHPSLVSCLILEEPPFQIISNLTPAVAAVIRRVEQLVGEGRLRDAAEAFLRFALSYRTGGGAFDTLEPALRESMLGNGGTLLPEISVAVEGPSAAQLQRITCPVTCLVGELTPEVVTACADRLVRILSHARIIRIAGAAHAIHIDQPERFVDAVRSAFVTGV